MRHAKNQVSATDAASLFSKLSSQQQDGIIALLKSLLSEQRPSSADSHLIGKTKK